MRLARQLKETMRLLTRGVRVRIRHGPCQGMSWSLPTRLKFLRGVYERPLAEFIAAAIRPDDVFWDIGAHFGYYSLLASRVAVSGRCCAFEPSARNLWYLRRHVVWNRIENVTIHPFALAASDGTARFGGHRGTGSGRLGEDGSPISVRAIDSLVSGRVCGAPTFLKVDVQGAEADVLAGGRNTLRGRAAVVCMATHNRHCPGVHARCSSLLAELGYVVHDFPKRQYIVAASPDRTLPPLPFAEIPPAAGPAWIEHS